MERMGESETARDEPFRRLVARIDPNARMLRAWTLTGGVSAEVTGLEIALVGGRREKLVVRRHGGRDLARNPGAARDEFALMRVAMAHGLAAPEPVYLDDTCDLFPTPVVVVAFCDGVTVVDPPDIDGYVAQAAVHLPMIHAIPAAPNLAFLPRQDRGWSDRPRDMDEAMREPAVRDALEAAWPLTSRNPEVLLHGDFWPGNLLWRDGELGAVIDWEDARVGDPLADLGNARLEFLWAYGEDAMSAFTDAYLAKTSRDPANLPYWDLCAALRPCGRLGEWGLEAGGERTMRERHAAFVAGTLDRLEGR